MTARYPPNLRRRPTDPIASMPVASCPGAAGFRMPGRGSHATRLGAAATARKGAAMPTPRAPKTSAMSSGPRASANPSAVPTNGAEQDAASNVAKAPSRNASANRPCARADPAAPATAPGSAIGSQSHKLAANRVVATAMPARNQGCWNWIPQPIAAPAALSAIRATASTPKEAITPEAVARRPNRATRRSAPP